MNWIDRLDICVALNKEKFLARTVEITPGGYATPESHFR